MKKFLALILSLIILTNLFSAMVFAENSAVLTLPANDAVPFEVIGEITLDNVIEYIPEQNGLMAYVAPPDWITQRNNTLYNHLAVLEDGAKLQALYNRLFDNLVAFTCDDYAKTTYYKSSNYICFNTSNIEDLTFKQMQQAFYALNQDNPQFFYLGRSLAMFYSNGKPYFALLLDDSYLTSQSRIEEVDAITDVIAQYDAIIDKNMTCYSIEKKVHDKLILDNNYAYDKNGNPANAVWSHSIAGSLNPKYGGGVCESYAKSLKLLLNRYEVPCYYVAGLANGGGHAWNYVMLDDGNYYCVDATWDDARVGTASSYRHALYYKYFNQPYSDFYAQRSNEEDYMAFIDALPQCSNNTTYYASTNSWRDGVLANGDLLGTAPNVSEEGTRVVTTTTTEALTESTTIASDKEYSTESTTCNLQPIAADSVKDIIVKKDSGNWSLTKFSNADYKIAMSSANNAALSTTLEGNCLLSFNLQLSSGNDYFTVYLDDVPVGEYRSTGYLITADLRLPKGIHNVKIVYNNSAGGSYGIVYKMNAIPLGDFDLDGTITLADVISIMSAENIASDNLYYLDVNNDGIVNSLDASLMLKIIANL